ncbi:MAG TPA: tetratricopeptide repeat protein [Pyrinomonadaceae bacterium]|nr:tetratricopeptide repeat protein [Pyrinomonadaceae bacterium]
MSADVPATKNRSVNVKLALIFVVGAVAGFVVGFALANSVNRQEQDRLRVELARAQTGATAKETPAAGPKQATRAAADDDASIPTLTDEQLKNAIAKADASPGDAELQKQVGQNLYVYSWVKGNASILPDVARILKRAHEDDSKDYKTTVMAGDAQFLIARNSSDTRPLTDARKLYEDALASRPDDAVVRTSLGLTYFYDKPSDPKRAIQEFRRVLQTDPRQEMAIQSLAAALIETGSLDEAAKRLDELEKLNSSNQELSNLRAQLEQKKNAAKEAK